MTRRNGTVHIAFVPKIVGRMNIIAAFSTMPLLIATISAAPARMPMKESVGEPSFRTNTQRHVPMSMGTEKAE